MKGIKGVSSSLLNKARGTRGSNWQVESFDRIMRDENEIIEKVEYMFMNPVKASLVEIPTQYDGWYLNMQPPAER